MYEIKTKSVQTKNFPFSEVHIFPSMVLSVCTPRSEKQNPRYVDITSAIDPQPSPINTAASPAYLAQPLQLAQQQKTNRIYESEHLT